MDIHQLDDAVRRYFAAALARSTHKTYAAAERRYLNFCKDFNLIPLPVPESTLCYFVACLGQQGLAHSSISTYLSGIRQVQISHEFGDPHLDQMSRLRQVLKGVRVEAGKDGRAPRSRLPITPAILRKLRAVWLHLEPLFNSKMLWATSTVTFISFCRSGEATIGTTYVPNTHLSISDLATDNAHNPSVVSLKIKHSKTDQGRMGVTVVIGKTGDDISPVSALLSYLVSRGTKPGALFLWANGSPLLKSKFVEEVRSALTKAGLPAKDYAGHSLRIGAATTAATVGIQDSAIQILGRWKSSSYQLYILPAPHQLAEVSQKLSKCSI